MRTAIAMIVVLTAICQTSNAQCGKTVKWTSSHTKFIDSSGNVQREMDENVLITITNNNVTILPSDAADEMNGPVSEYACEWANSKNGSTSFKAVVTDPRGDVKHLTFSIKGKDDKINVQITVEEMAGLQVLLDGVSFEESN